MSGVFVLSKAGIRYSCTAFVEEIAISSLKLIYLFPFEIMTGLAFTKKTYILFFVPYHHVELNNLKFLSFTIKKANGSWSFKNHLIAISFSSRKSHNLFLLFKNSLIQENAHQHQTQYNQLVQRLYYSTNY